VIEQIAHLLEHETAGDPIKGLKWRRRATRKIAQQLRRLKIHVSASTVRRLLKQMGYSLRVNHKKLESGNKNLPPPRVRHQQFGYIERQRKQFLAQGNPIISIDAKKREMIGNFKQAKELFILADSGGGNSARSRAWPYHLQQKLVNPHRLTVTVSHYLPGASKWNPIEHRVFCQISKNWAGQPLKSFQTALNYIRTTTTLTGLKVRARLLRKKYEKGERISAQEMKHLALTRHKTLPKWNYTLRPM
jgi:DDE family transposase